jgi:glucokinase
MIDHQWERLQPEVIDRACELGDPLAIQAWTRVGEKVGLALVSVVNLLNPERIVVGGGIAKAGRWLFEPMRQTVRRRAMRDVARVSIVPAKLGSSAGLIGAALLAQEAGDGE